MKRLILLVMCCFATYYLFAQLTTNEQPYGLKNYIGVNSKDKIVLTAPNKTLIETEDSESDKNNGPVRYAYPVTVNFTLKNSGVWQQLEDGSKIWRLKVNIPNALSTNTYYDKFWLPIGAKFFVYNENTRQSIGAVTSDFIEGSKEKPAKFATALIYGEDVIYEYYQPASLEEMPDIIISRIDYGYRYINNPFSNSPGNFGDSGPCQVNINCPEEGSNWQMEKHASVRISFPMFMGSGWASGALVNNTSYDNTPYVLTADHNLVDNFWGVRMFDADPVPNSIFTPSSDGSGMIFYWEYEHPTCVNNITEPLHLTTIGATIVANNSNSDFALLKLYSSQDPRKKQGVSPYYLGWDRSGNAGTGGVGIHHPNGDIKKISTYTATPINSNCSNSNFWDIGFVQTANGFSVMQPGSSGSPLINSNKKVIGQLFGPGYCSTVQCEDPAAQIVAYGKFSISWTGNNSNSHKRRLKDWLDPLEANPTTLNGTLPISGPSLLCRNTDNFTVTNPPAGFSWNVSSNLSIYSTNNNTASIEASNYYYTHGSPGWVSIKNSSGVEVARKEVWVGYPDAQISGNYYVGPTGRFTSIYNPLSNPNAFDWYMDEYSPTGYSISSYGNYADVYFYESDAFRLQLSICNVCGCDTISKVIQAYVYSPSSPPAYPNPVSDILNIEIDQQMIDNAKAKHQIAIGAKYTREPVFEFHLYNELGSQVRYAIAKSGIVQFNVSNLPNGLYYLHINDGLNNTPDKQIIWVKH